MRDVCPSAVRVRVLEGLFALLAATGCGSASATAGHDDAGVPGSPASQADASNAPSPDASGADSGGSAEASASVVHSCSGLSGATGHWQNISPSAFTSPPNMEVLAVVVNPQDDSVFAAAGNVTNGSACPAGTTCPSAGTGIYKSTDCGATWSRVSDTTPGTDSANLLTGDPWAMLIDPVEPQTLYVNNGYGSGPTLYKSVDGGVHWASLNPDPALVVGKGSPFVQAIAIDPRDHMHLAVTFHDDCGSPYTPWCFSRSSDGGATWKEFNGPTSVPGFTIDGWMEASSISDPRPLELHRPVPGRRVLPAATKEARGRSFWLRLTTRATPVVRTSVRTARSTSATARAPSTPARPHPPANLLLRSTRRRCFPSPSRDCPSRRACRRR